MVKTYNFKSGIEEIVDTFHYYAGREEDILGYFTMSDIWMRTPATPYCGYESIVRSELEARGLKTSNWSYIRLISAFEEIMDEEFNR